MRNHETVWRFMAWAGVLVAGLAQPVWGNPHVAANQDFEGYSNTPVGSTFITMADGWSRHYAAVQSTKFPNSDVGAHAGEIRGTNPQPGRLRYWASPALTKDVGTLTFDALIHSGHATAETDPNAELIVFLSSTNRLDTPYSHSDQGPFHTITLGPENASGWSQQTVVFERYDAVGKYLIIGREDPQTDRYRVQIDNILLMEIPATLTPTALGLIGGVTSRRSDQTLSPQLTVEPRGSVDDPAAILHYRYSGQASYLPVAMVPSGNSFILDTPLPAQNQSGRQLEMYAVLTYTNQAGPAEHTFPEGGGDNPVRIDILPTTAQTSLSIQGGLSATLGATTNNVWRGGLERGAGVTGPTYQFASPATTWGSPNENELPPFRREPVSGLTLPSPAAPLERDLLFAFRDISPLEMTAEYGEFQSFDDWANTAAQGWTLGSGASLVEDAELAYSGDAALLLDGTGEGWIESPPRLGARTVGFWFRRAGTSPVTVTVQKQVGGSWVPAGTVAPGLPTDSYAYRSLALNDPQATRIRWSANAPVYVDDLSITDVSRVEIGARTVIPDPVVSQSPADFTVEVNRVLGATIATEGVVLRYRYGLTGAFTEVPLVLNGGLYQTIEAARIAAPVGPQQDLQTEVTVTYTGWDGSTLPVSTSPRDTWQVVPTSPAGWTSMSVAGDLEAPLWLAADGLWRGALRLDAPVENPEFWYEDSTDGVWGSPDASTLPAFGPIVGSTTFELNETLSGSVAFSLNELTGEYIIQSAEYEPFEDGVLQPGWSSDNLALGETVAVQGEAALSTAANASITSPERVGFGEVSFWLALADAEAGPAGYVVEMETDPDVWTAVSGGSGTVVSAFYRQVRVPVGHPTASRVRVRLDAAGVRIDELVATAAGAYVGLSNPLFNGTTPDPVVVPLLSYGGTPTMQIEADPQNGATDVQVFVAFAYDAQPEEVATVALSGDPVLGGVFSGPMPALAVGTVRYWFETTYGGLNAATGRYPATGYYRYETDSALSTNRKPTIDTWQTQYYAVGTQQSWLLRGVYVASNSAQIDPNAANRDITSPGLNGAGTLYFKARATNIFLQETHQLVVEVAKIGAGPYTPVETLTVPVGEAMTQFKVVLNDYRNPVHVRIRRITGSSNELNRIIIRDIVISPPPAQVTLTEPSVINPGYPSMEEAITFHTRVQNVSSSYPASNFRPKLVWQWANQDWVSTDMTHTGDGHYEVTLDALPPGLLQYYTRVDFTGASYTYFDGTTTHFEGRSPSFLGTNNVQTALSPPSPKQVRVRRFRSSHDFIELQRYDAGGEYTPMQLVGEQTWQAVLYLTEAVEMDLQFAGHAAYVPDAISYAPMPEFWGDNDQDTINPPLSGNAGYNQADIKVEMDYVGFVMFRFNAVTGLYEVRRAAFQDFNTWQAPDDVFDESIGLFAIENYPANFEGLAVTTPVEVLDTNFNNVDISPFNPPFADVAYRANWRLENAWIVGDRFAHTSVPVGQTPEVNRAVMMNPGAGSIQSTPELHTRGRETLTFRHRVRFGDENVPFHRHGFAWSSYRVSTRAGISQATPANPSISLIAYYYDQDNWYELRVRQIRNLTANENAGRDDVVIQLYRKTDGAYITLGDPVSVPNVSLAGNSLDLALQIAPDGGNIGLTGTVTPLGGSATPVTFTDTSPGVLVNGGSISFNTRDAAANFSNITAVTVPGENPVPGFSNNPGDWWLGGQRTGGGGTRWTQTGSVIGRAVPTVPFDVGIVRTGESTELPGQPVWTTVGGTQQSTSLQYSTVNLPLRTWDYTFLRIRPQPSDGWLVVDDLYAHDWRGVNLTDPTRPAGDTLTNSVWRATEAYITSRGGSKKLELTRSRANPDLRQMIRSPILDDGVGTISFNYEVTGGTVRFAVERASFDGLVEDDDPWELVGPVFEAPAGSSGDEYFAIRENMIGRVRVRLLPTSDPAATLWLDNLNATSYPDRGDTSWQAYNALITAGQPTRTFEPDIPGTRTAFLNNSATANVPQNVVFDESLPYIESPEIATGIGEIGFWFRVWDPNIADIEERPGQLRLMKGPYLDAPEHLWSEVTLLDPGEDAEYKNRLSNITNGDYEYFSIEIFDENNRVLRIYSETNQASRVALDNIIVTEPVRTSIDILSVQTMPPIPMADDPVDAEVILGNPRMNPTNIRVFLDYYLGTNVWGSANWGAADRYDPARLYDWVELTQDPAEPFRYTTETARIPARPVDSVVQYRVVVTYQGTFAAPVEYAEFTNPEWYFPVDLNATYDGFSAYYFVFSSPPGMIRFNEFFYALTAAYENQEFIELIGPQNASLAGWRVDVVDAAQSAVEDTVTTSYTLPAGSFLHSGINGWGFFVLGDTHPDIIDSVDYVMPDGGNPDVTPPETARLPSSGGFRLVRSMGAFADRISYGSHANATAGGPMVERGYTYTSGRLGFGAGLSQSIGLRESPLEEGVLTWWTIDRPLWTVGSMNYLQEEVMGSTDPYPDPSGPQAALALAITGLQLQGGQVVVSAWAESLNEVTDLTGWSGVLETNAVPSSTGWGPASGAPVAFTVEGEYDFTTDEPASPMMFRIRANPGVE